MFEFPLYITDQMDEGVYKHVYSPEGRGRQTGRQTNKQTMTTQSNNTKRNDYKK